MKETVLKRIIGIIAGVLGITLVIVVHEFGHFLACKLYKVHTPTFSIGFDPAIFSVKAKTTTFQIGAIPLGGYVSIDQYDMARLSYFKKMLIILAGILFNFIFAFFILSYLRIRKTKINDIENSNNNKKTDLFSLIKKSKPENVDFAIPEAQKKGFIGPIGIISLLGKSLSLDFNIYLYFLAIISLNVGFLNLLPIPFFDGGQALTITLEALIGKQLPENVIGFIFYLVLLLFIVFSIVLSYKDIKKLRKKN